MADYSQITTAPEPTYGARQLAKQTERQNGLLERQTVALERIAAAAEQAVEQLKGINHSTGVPDYVFTAIDKTPEVLEAYMISMNNNLEYIGNSNAAIADATRSIAAKK